MVVSVASLVLPCFATVRPTAGLCARPRPRMVPVTMAVPPIGPFCPFRSSSCDDDSVLAERMESLTAKGPRIMTEMARVQLVLQNGGGPDDIDQPRTRAVAEELKAAVDEWETVLTRMGMSDDFQSREYRKMSIAHLESQGQSSAGVGLMMRWQADCLLALADGRGPPMPPAGLDMEAMMKAAQGGDGSSSPMSAMGAATSITSTPFLGTEAVFESELVRDEYQALCKDHDALVRMGEGYGGFDPLGKLAFLDALEAVEERWDVLFARFSLMGALNPQFRTEVLAFLASMGITAEGFRSLLREAHELMRRDAEAERM